MLRQAVVHLLLLVLALTASKAQRPRELLRSRPVSFEAVQLVNTQTNQAIGNLTNGQVIALDEIGLSTPSFNLRAILRGKVRAVVFEDVEAPFTHTERSAPYAYCGHSGPRYPPCPTLGVGTHTIRLSTVPRWACLSSKQGASLTVTFTIVASRRASPSTPSASPVNAPIASPVTPVAAPTSGSAPAPSIPNAVPSSPNADPSAPNAVPSTPSAPNTVPSIPSAPNAVPSAPNSIPSAPNAVPSIPNAVPSTPNSIPSAPNAVPSIPNAVPSAPNAVPMAPMTPPPPRAMGDPAVTAAPMVRGSGSAPTRSPVTAPSPMVAPLAMAPPASPDRPSTKVAVTSAPKPPTSMDPGLPTAPTSTVPKSPTTAPVPKAPTKVPTQSPTKAPTSGVWIDSDTPIIRRYQGCFVMVDNAVVGRRAYLVGGIGDNVDTDVYNPFSKAWTKAPRPPIALSHMTCVAAQGKLWIMAAWTGTNQWETNPEYVYVFDPATNAWGTKTALPLARRRGSAAVIVSPDQTKIYVSHGTTGGHEKPSGNFSVSLPFLDVYDIATDSWTALSSSAPNVRDHAGGAMIGTTLLCMAGGRHGGANNWPNVAPTDCYNLTSGVWSVQDPIPQVRSRAQYLTTCDGKLMVLGGETGGKVYNNIDIFDGTKWTKRDALPVGRHSAGLALDCACSQMHLVSGMTIPYGSPDTSAMTTYFGSGAMSDCTVFAPPTAPTPVRVVEPTAACPVPKFQTATWQNARPYPLKVAEAQGAMIGSTFVVYGGFHNDWSKATASTHTLDTSNATATWQKVDDIPISPGLTHGAHVHVGSKIYNCGGYVGGHPGVHTTTCVVYDHAKPLGQTWSTIQPLPEGRGGGGMFYNSFLNAIYYVSGAQRYRKAQLETLDFNTTWRLSLSDPNSAWVRQADLPYASNHMMAVTTKDASGTERHFAFGGQYREDEYGGNYAYLYEYDALRNVWIRRQDLPQTRAHASSSTLAYGCGFLTIAGNTNGGIVFNKITYYNVATDRWTEIGTLPENLNTPVCDINRNTNQIYCETGKLDAFRSFTNQLLPV